MSSQRTTWMVRNTGQQSQNESIRPRTTEHAGLSANSMRLPYDLLHRISRNREDVHCILKSRRVIRQINRLPLTPTTSKWITSSAHLQRSKMPSELFSYDPRSRHFWMSAFIARSFRAPLPRQPPFACLKDAPAHRHKNRFQN